MKLIAGLGNTGPKYKNNRHNLGFILVDSFVKSQGLSWRYGADFMCYWLKSNKFLVIKPTTYMNKSGASVKAVSGFYKIEIKNILVVHDDLDLDFGKITTQKLCLQKILTRSGFLPFFKYLSFQILP